MKSNNKFNKLLVLILVLFLITAAMMTYVSRAKYIDSLPLVQTVSSATGVMEKTYNVTGTITADRDLEKVIYAPADLRITGVYTETGDVVREDQVLITFDARQLEISLLTLKSALMDLESADNEIDNMQQRITELKIEETREAIDDIQKLIDDGGIIASRSSDITYCISPTTVQVSCGQPLVRFVTFPTKKSIKFSLPYTDKVPNVGDCIFCDLTVVNDNGNTRVLVDERIEISNRRVENNTAFYTADISIGNVYMHDGEQLDLETSYVGTKEYDNILPRSAVDIQSDNNGIIYVLSEWESIMGTEVYTRMLNVHILDYDDERVAIEDVPDEEIVRYIQGINDGMIVRTW